jgi:hypothetical protein
MPAKTGKRTYATLFFVYLSSYQTKRKYLAERGILSNKALFTQIETWDWPGQVKRTTMAL